MALHRSEGPRVPRRIKARRTRSRSDQERGFTLIELLVVVAILPLVVGAISVGLISVLKNEQPLSNSLTSSGDEQVASATFVQDVQGANWITNNPLDVCGGVSGTLLLSLSPDDVTSPSAIENVTSYVEVPNGGTTNTYTIDRETCSGGTGSSAATPIRGVIHGASGATSVSALPTPLDPTKNWQTASSETSVTLNLQEPTGNSYALTAIPRPTQTPGQTPTGGFQPILPLELVGSCPGVQFTGGSSSLKVEDGNGGPGEIGVTQSQTGCSSAGGIASGSPPATFSSGTQFYGVTNPLASLTAPSFPSLAGLGAGSCSATTCTSGIYGANTTGAYSDGNVSNVTFDPSLGPDPGIVVFTVPVTASGVTFDGGASVTSVTYWFQGGLTIADHATVTFGSATYIYGTSGGSGSVLQMGNHATIAVPNSSPGLLFYVPPGAANVSLGPGFSGTLAGALSPYLDVALWDASSGTLSFGQGNGGGAGLASFGGIYDPNGTVQITGGYNMQATFFVVASFSIQTSAILATG
jgi:prepilin-type N-terminal cleavage/methylation domain-containing protein